MDLLGLDRFQEKSETPSGVSFIYYILLEKGLSLKDICELPCPYLLDIISTYAYIKNEEEKEMNKVRRK